MSHVQENHPADRFPSPSGRKEGDESLLRGYMLFGPETMRQKSRHFMNHPSQQVATSLAPQGEPHLPACFPTPPRLVAGWLLSYASPNTLRAYRRGIGDWLAWCGQVGVDALGVRRVHVDAYARVLTEQGRSPASVARELACLSAFYRYAVAEEVIAANPVELVRRPKLSPDYSPTFGLSRSEAATLIRTADSYCPRSAALVNLLLSNGLRVGEVLGINIEDLGTREGHHTAVITRKGGVRAVIPLAPKVAHAVRTYIGDRESGPLFLTKNGKRWDQPAVFRHLRSLARKAGLENAERISPHSLRHTSITAGLDADISLRDMQDFAGHADPRTTRRYDRGRNNLDRNPTYAITTYLATGEKEAT